MTPLELIEVPLYRIFLFIKDHTTVKRAKGSALHMAKWAMTWTLKPKLKIINRNGAFSLTCPAAMQIYWNNRKFLHKKRV